GYLRINSAHTNGGNGTRLSGGFFSSRKTPILSLVINWFCLRCSNIRNNPEMNVGGWKPYVGGCADCSDLLPLIAKSIVHTLPINPFILKTFIFQHVKNQQITNVLKIIFYSHTLNMLLILIIKCLDRKLT